MKAHKRDDKYYREVAGHETIHAGDLLTWIPPSSDPHWERASSTIGMTVNQINDPRTRKVMVLRQIDSFLYAMIKAS